MAVADYEVVLTIDTLRALQELDQAERNLYCLRPAMFDEQAIIDRIIGLVDMTIGDR